MRRAFFALVIIGAVVDAASACTDTLYLAGMRQFSLSFKNVRNSQWDSTIIPIVQAGTARALSMAPVDDTSTFSMPVQFRSNCGTDSVSAVSYLKLSNIPYKLRGTNYWKDTSEVFTASVKALSYPDGVVYNGEALKSFWEIGNAADGKAVVGKLGSGNPMAYHMQFAAFRYLPNGSYSYSTYPAFARPSRTQAFETIDGLLDGFSAALDSVGKGLDSVRISVRITETSFSYDPTAWALATGVQSRAMRPQAFTSYRTSRGYVFVLPRPTALTIFSPEGNVVRTLPAASAPAWDGNDASGHRVPHGVYLVRALGLGVLRIPAP